MSNLTATKKRKEAPGVGMDADLLAHKRAQSRRSSQKHRIKQQLLTEELAKKQNALKLSNDILKTKNEKLADQIALVKGYGYGKKKAASSLIARDVKSVASTISRASIVASSGTVASHLTNKTPLLASPRLQASPVPVLSRSQVTLPLAGTPPGASHPTRRSVSSNACIAALQDVIEAIRAQERLTIERVKLQRQFQDLGRESCAQLRPIIDHQIAAATAFRPEETPDTASLRSLLLNRRGKPTNGSRSVAKNGLRSRPLLNQETTVLADTCGTNNLSLEDFSTNQIEQFIRLRLSGAQMNSIRF